MNGFFYLGFGIWDWLNLFANFAHLVVFNFVSFRKNIMRVILTLIITLIISISAIAQNNLIEKTFEKNRRTFSVTKFAFGEDASSGWDYLVYRQKTSTKKIRSIWSNYSDVTVDDYYFEAGKPVLLVEYFAKKSQYKSLAKGVNLTLKVKQKFYFTDSKLVTWIENGKSVSATDSRWAEREKAVLASFADQLDTYRMHLKGEL